MKIQRSIVLKAIFLLIVFFLNTVVGFACVLGADMGFNMMQQHQDVPHHQDAGQKEHHHPNAAKQITKHQKDNCCKDEVTKLTTADKETQSAPAFSFQLSFLAILPAPIYIQDNISSIPANIPNTYFARHSRAPMPDVRIAIQSFQI